MRNPAARFAITRSDSFRFEDVMFTFVVEATGSYYARAGRARPVQFGYLYARTPMHHCTTVTAAIVGCFACRVWVRLATSYCCRFPGGGQRRTKNKLSRNLQNDNNMFCLASIIDIFMATAGITYRLEPQSAGLPRKPHTVSQRSVK